MAKQNKKSKIAIVAQHNNLVRSDLAFSTLEAKVFTRLLETIPRDAEQLGQVSLKISDVLGAGTSGKHYKLLHEAIKSLDSRRINLLKVDAGPYDYDSCALFDSMEMKVGQNLIRGEWGKKIQPYLIQLKKGFTLGELDILLNLKSGHSYKLYWVLRSYESLTEFTDTVENLKTILVKKEEGKSDKYAQWNDLKRYVLQPAIDEVKYVSAERGNPMTFDVQLIKQGKKVVEVRFYNIKSANTGSNRNLIQEGQTSSEYASAKADSSQQGSYEGKVAMAYKRLIESYGLTPAQAVQVVENVPQNELWPVMKQLNLDIITNKLHERKQPPVTAGAWSVSLLKQRLNKFLKWPIKDSSEQATLAL